MMKGSITISCSLMRHHLITSGWHWWKSAYSNTIQQERLGEIGIMWARKSCAESALCGVCSAVTLSRRCREGRKSGWIPDDWLNGLQCWVRADACSHWIIRRMTSSVQAQLSHIIRINEKHMSLSNTHTVTGLLVYTHLQYRIVHENEAKLRACIFI